MVPDTLVSTGQFVLFDFGRFCTNFVVVECVQLHKVILMTVNSQIFTDPIGPFIELLMQQEVQPARIEWLSCVIGMACCR